jgi:DNA-binding XRE family transcriptional regulator
MTFGQKLRRARERAKLTQEALAQAADMSVSSIVKMEAGRMVPSWTTVQALSRALGLSCEDLTDDQEPKRGKSKK